MTLDSLIPQIEMLRQQGCVVLLKWDGERNAKVTTVVVTNASSDYVWRKDSDDIIETLRQAISDFALHVGGTNLSQ